jgi:predicted RNA-binding protein with PUA-like domain
MAKSYFLLKSEPNLWSLDQQIKSGSRGSMWDGVRNYQAANNLFEKIWKLYWNSINDISQLWYSIDTR